MLKRLMSALVVALLAAALPALANDAADEIATAQTAWKLLDYIAIDYSGAVDDGAIIDEAEYEEMVEFSQLAQDHVLSLPDKTGRAGLEQQIAALRSAINRKATVDEVARLAQGSATSLLQLYPVPIAPSETPDLARGAALYQAECASCHGAKGDADGPLSADLDPPAIAFTDRERALQRSIFGLAQVIEQGLDDTSMASYSHLPPADRWALAFHSASLVFTPAEIEAGRKLWQNRAELRRQIDPEQLVMLTPAALAEQLGTSEANAIMAFVRAHPEAVFAEQQAGALTFARQKLAEAMTAYEQGRHKEASNLALSAYLDGFEPIEPIVAARDKALMIRVETAMAHVRSSIAKQADVETVREHLATVDALFAEVEGKLAGNGASAVATFLGAFTILVREGLEAILIVIAMIMFLRKAERTEALPYLHGGWISALVAGLLTWAAATWVIEISGASRELTEGFGSVLAALILLWVGLWMHDKSHADGWQRYIQGQMSSALSGRKGGWMVFGLAFLVVYREVFETILFYTALWAQGSGGALLAGAATALLLLAIIAWAMIFYSKRLPIGEFFLYSSILIAVLAVVLIGKGISALQEAGWVATTPWPAAPRVELLGLYPTAQGVLAQIGMIMLIGLGVLWNRRQTPQAS